MDPPCSPVPPRSAQTALPPPSQASSSSSSSFLPRPPPPPPFLSILLLLPPQAFPQLQAFHPLGFLQQPPARLLGPSFCNSCAKLILQVLGCPQDRWKQPLPGPILAGLRGRSIGGQSSCHIGLLCTAPCLCGTRLLPTHCLPALHLQSSPSAWSFLGSFPELSWSCGPENTLRNQSSVKVC